MAANPFGRAPVRFGFASGAPPDVVALVAVVFVTFSLQFFSATAGLVEMLRLTPRVWASGFVWQVVTYPVAGVGAPTIWILLELFVLFWFGRDVLSRRGRPRFWRLLATATVIGAGRGWTWPLMKICIRCEGIEPVAMIRAVRV